MKNLSSYFFCGVFLICLNFNANSRGVNNAVYPFYGMERVADNKHRGVSDIKSPRVDIRQLESNKKVERITEIKDYVTTQNVSKTLESITTFAYDENNWNIERYRKFINQIPGITINAKDNKLISTYLSLPENCVLQTNVNYNRDALQETLEWIEQDRNTVKFDSKRRSIESINATSKTIVQYDDLNKKEEAIFYIKRAEQPESDFKLEAKIERQSFDVPYGVTIQQYRYAYRDNLWLLNEFLEEEKTLDGNDVFASNRLIGDDWYRSKGGAKYDTEGRTLYESYFEWNEAEGKWSYGYERSYAYDDMGRMIFEQDDHVKSVYDGYTKFTPGNYVPTNMKIYKRKGYNEEWELYEDYMFLQNDNNDFIGIEAYRIVDGERKLVKRSRFERQSATQYAVFFSDLSEKDLWIENMKSVTTTNLQGEIEQVSMYYKSSESSLWELSTLEMFRYLSDNEVVIKSVNVEDGGTRYEQKLLTTYPTDETYSVARYICPSENEADWYITEPVEFYKKNGAEDYFLYSRSTFNLLLEQANLPTLPNGVTKVKSTKYSLDLNGDNVFDNELGTYITYVKDSGEQLVFAYDRKLNDDGKDLYNIRYSHPDFDGRFFKDERNFIYNSSGNLQSSVRVIGQTPTADVTRTTEYTYEDAPGGVEMLRAQEESDAVSVYGDSRLYIDSKYSFKVGVYSLEGAEIQTLQVAEGVNEFSIPKGFYILKSIGSDYIKGVKILIR